MTDVPEFNGWQHAKQAASFVRANAGAAVKACAPWLILITATMAAATPAAIWLVQNNIDFAVFVRSINDDRMVGLIIAAPSILMTALAWPSIAVAWHRFVLRHEPPAPLPLSLRGILYLLSATAILLAVYIVPVMLAVAGLAVVGGRFNLVVVLVPLAIFVGALGLAMRLTLKLPAIALADSRMTIARSWRETEAMWPGMLWGTVVLTLPVYLATTTVDIIAGNLADQGQTEIAILLTGIHLTAVFIGVVLYSTFLSLCYRRAVGDTSGTFE